MALDPDACYRALSARDTRFDGVFFVGVTTTGVYCRPICPARVPKRANCTFFGRADEAERAGFRACFRCRPELAPGLASVDAVPRLAERALARITRGYLDEHSLEDLARSVGVSSRHLRRAMDAELGATPVALAQTRRLGLAKHLFQDTSLSIADVAFASGFRSVRRFNALFKERYGRPPSSLRRERRSSDREAITLRLDYRPPLEWQNLLAFLRDRATAGVEAVEDDVYRRSVAIGTQSGWLVVSRDGSRPALRARLSPSLAPKIPVVVGKLRALFDLDARPDVVDEQLSCDPRLMPLVRARPGLRVPGAFDGFEVAVRAILGQQVQVRAATTLSGRLAARFGEPLTTPLPGIDRLFPNARTLATASADDVAEVGLPRARARTIVELSRATVEGRLDLSAGADPRRVVEALTHIPGIGPWTAEYVAMRALAWPDAFPSSDLVLRKALGGVTPRAAEARAERWRPWRSYAVLHLWASWADGTASATPTRKGA